MGTHASSRAKDENGIFGFVTYLFHLLIIRNLVLVPISIKAVKSATALWQQYRDWQKVGYCRSMHRLWEHTCVLSDLYPIVESFLKVSEDIQLAST